MGNQHFLVMGVAGCGKSTLGAMLADSLDCTFIEGDDYHADTSVKKMSEGVPLTDEDRWGWLERLNELLTNAEGPTVLACSALKEKYRDVLCRGLDISIVFLDVDLDTIMKRVQRRDHFFPVSLVEDQFATLEAPTPDQAVVLDGRVDPKTLRDELLELLN